MATTTSTARRLPTASDSHRRDTQHLLAAGAAAGPLYALVAWVQVVTVDGFDITRHALSQLSLGPYGWIQITNFLATGMLFIAGAVGLRQVLPRRRGGTWGPRLLGAFGVSLIIAGLFATDPAHGFPVGTPAQGPTSWHGLVHAIAPSLGITLAAVCCFIFARTYLSAGRRSWAAASILIGLVMFLPDAYPGATHPGYTLALAITGTLGFLWCSLVALDQLRRLPTTDQDPSA